MGECQCAILTRSQWLLGPGETWLGSSFFSPLNAATFHTCLEFNTIISWLVRYFSPLWGDWHLHKYLLPLWCDMSKVSGCTMVEKPDRGDRDSSNKLVDSGSKQPSPPVPLAGTGATNTAPTQVQSPHRTGKVRPWEGDPITQSVQSPQHQALPWETASVPPSVVPYNPSGWTSEPNSPPSKRPSYLPAYNKRDSSSVFESESDSELSSMEGPSSYFSFGKNLQCSQSNISERSYSYIQDQAVSTPMSMYGSVEQLYSGGYPYSSLASPLCNSTSSIPASVASMDIYYPPYSISSGYPVSSAGYSPMCQNMYHPYWMCYSCRKPKM